MQASSFNDFDGNKIVKLLIKRADLWRGFVWGRDGGWSNLITLRDIEDNIYNADTLHILPKEGKEDELKSFVTETFNADEIDYIGSKQACDLLGSWSKELETNQKSILRVWWD